ncbi:MAG TPA: hypothetical protein DDY31_01825 [Lachnospiraceae bacterium]|nr:hypothetical protein [Lachnospiraceae bacterium]
MLEEKDLEVLQNMMETVIDKRIAESEKNMEAMMDRKITESENLILKEMDRVQINLTNKINEVQKNLDELSQYYRITKLENDNTALLLKMIDELSKRVEELEKKTA